MVEPASPKPQSPSPFFDAPYTGDYWTVERITIEQPPLKPELFVLSGMTREATQAVAIKAAKASAELEGQAEIVHASGDTITAAMLHHARILLLEIELTARLAVMKWLEVHKKAEETARRKGRY
jgi:hypothetical protein